jgi:CubicO group peptidase (beta-lactamase class C family)
MAPEAQQKADALLATMRDESTIPGRAFVARGGVSALDIIDRLARMPPFLCAEIGSANATSSARSLAKMYAALAAGGELDGVRLLSRKTIHLMDSNHLPPGVTRGAAGGGTATGEGYGLGVRVVTDPAQAGILASAGTFGWSGAAGTHFFVDRAEELVAVFMVQKMGAPDGPGMAAQFETLVYQAIAD